MEREAGAYAKTDPERGAGEHRQPYSSVTLKSPPLLGEV
jgi:hypothetical protein